jgi:hypothetical protein
MAKADSVPSSSRQLITGDSANQSTNLRVANLPAANLPAVRVKPADRRYLVDGSVAHVTNGSDKAPLLRFGRDNQGDEPDPVRCCSYGANAGEAPVSSNVEALFFLGRLLRRIVLSLLWFVSRNKRSRDSALDKVSSNQLVPSRPQERP